MRDERHPMRDVDSIPTTERLLTKAQAAERLNVSPRFVQRCVAERRIRFVRVGRFIRVPESAIEELVAAGTVDVSRRARASTRKP